MLTGTSTGSGFRVPPDNEPNRFVKSAIVYANPFFIPNLMKLGAGACYGRNACVALPLKSGFRKVAQANIQVFARVL